MWMIFVAVLAPGLPAIPNTYGGGQFATYPQCESARWDFERRWRKDDPRNYGRYRHKYRVTCEGYNPPPVVPKFPLSRGV